MAEQPAVLAPPTIEDLPQNVLDHILLTSGTANFVVHVSVCARVCRAWRRALLERRPISGDSRLAYGAELFSSSWALGAHPGRRPPRAHETITRQDVLADVARRLDGIKADTGYCCDMTVPEGGLLSAAQQRIYPGAAVAARAREAVVSAALRAFPSGSGGTAGALPFTIVRFGDCTLRAHSAAGCFTAPTLVPLLENMGARGVERLTRIDVTNSKIGDTGIVALAKMLPAGVKRVLFKSTDCGDDGLCAMAEALPQTSVVTLDCSENPRVTERGFAALLDALPGLPLEKMEVRLEFTRGWSRVRNRENHPRAAWLSFKGLLREQDRLDGVLTRGEWWWRGDAAQPGAALAAPPPLPQLS